MVGKTAARYRGLAGLVLIIPVLAGCSAGVASRGFIEARLMDAYIPLSVRTWLLSGRWAAGVAVAPNIAVTNAHNENLIPPQMVLARSRDYDLLFFRTDMAPAPVARPQVGEDVIAYGQGSIDELREAKGAIRGLDEYVAPRCAECRAQRAIVFDAEAGGGFSGGPVVDAKSGAVLGITFGYLDGKANNGGRRMYAYDIDLVLGEMRRLLAR
jgi:Trypsin-like peptidase domain